MSEQMTEEQILGAFENDRPANSSEPEAPQEQPKPAPQVEGEDAPSGEEVQTQEAASEEPQETQTIEIDPDEPLFEQEVADKDGRKKVEKLSLKELQRGYIAQAETTRRFQEAARLRAEAQDAARKAEQQAIAEATKRLDEFHDYVIAATAPELKNVDWNKLASEDAFEYVRLSNRANQINQTLAAIKAEKAKLEEKQKEEKNKSRLERIAKADEVLRGEIPDYGDAVMSRFIKAAEDAGFTREELQDFDHRLFRLAYKAAQFEDLKAKETSDKDIAKKKIAIVQKGVLKPGTKPKQSSAVDEAMKTLKRTGKPEDALPIFEAMIR